MVGCADQHAALPVDQDRLSAAERQRPHLAARGLVLAMHRFQATAVGQAGELRSGLRIRILGAIALFASMTNIVSGFLITDRMLRMFKTDKGAGGNR